MTQRMNDGVPQADGSKLVEPRFDVEHVARAVVQMAELPLDTNVLFMDHHGDENAVCRARLAATAMTIDEAKAHIDEYGYAVHQRSVDSGPSQRPTRPLGRIDSTGAGPEEESMSISTAPRSACGT